MQAKIDIWALQKVRDQKKESLKKKHHQAPKVALIRFNLLIFEDCNEH